MAFWQWWSSDKVAMRAMRAREVTPEEAPELHGMIDRLCALADMPKPRVGISDMSDPQRLRHRSLARPGRRVRDDRHPADPRRRGAGGGPGPRAEPRRPPRRAGDDGGLVGRHRRRAADALRAVRRDGPLAQQQHPAGRAGRARRQPRRVRRQLPAAAPALALPRAQRRPGRRLPHAQAGRPRLRAAEDQRRGRRDPAARPAREQRRQRAVHRPRPERRRSAG